MPQTIFPSIIPDADGEFVDDSYRRAELERLDGRQLQSLAADHPTDECHGRDAAEDIVDALVGKQRVETEVDV